MARKVKDFKPTVPPEGLFKKPEALEEKTFAEKYGGEFHLPPVRITVLGLQGSGKTYLVKRALLDMEPNHLVLDPNDEYGGYTRYVPRFAADPDRYREEFNLVAKRLIYPHVETLEDMLARKVTPKREEKRLKLLVIDEADLLAPARRPMPGALHDLYVKSRHYRLTVVAISRRLTDLSTYIMDTSDNLILFKTVGYNALRIARAINKDIEEELSGLDFKRYEFLFLNRQRQMKKYTLADFPVGMVGT